ncbi:hypothetical protein [Nocardioides speluncae]|uniref:hypothetical protein n=1 Tax=Nocardioides speluncae TaxID=2670337 RepID=UPI000D6885DC|nr:hypothetical protein [Nocardioides speluncae]
MSPAERELCRLLVLDFTDWAWGPGLPYLIAGSTVLGAAYGAGLYLFCRRCERGNWANTTHQPLNGDDQ